MTDLQDSVTPNDPHTTMSVTPSSYMYPIKRGQGRGLVMVGAKPRVFQMIRHVDGKQLSGTGRVIDGVVFADGTVVIQWQGDKQSIGIYKDLNHFISIHVKPKYENENEFRWHDGYKPSDDVAEVCDTVKDYVLRSQTMKQIHKGAIIGLLKGILKKYEEITPVSDMVVKSPADSTDVTNPPEHKPPTNTRRIEQ